MDLSDLFVDNNEELLVLVFGTGFGSTTDIKIGTDEHISLYYIDGDFFMKYRRRMISQFSFHFISFL